MKQVEELYQYLVFLETYRKKQKIKLNDFIFDVTSERSYRRYLDRTMDVPVKVIAGLVEKYDLNYADLVQYIGNQQSKPSHVIDLLRWITVEDPKKALGFADELRSYANDTIYLNTLVKVFVAYADYLNNKIDEQHIKNLLDEHVGLFDEAPMDVVVLSFYVFYMKFFKSSKRFDHHEITKYFLEEKFYLQQILVYDYVLHMYLSFLEDEGLQDEAYYQLVKLYKVVAEYWIESIGSVFAIYHQVKVLLHLGEREKALLEAKLLIRTVRVYPYAYFIKLKDEVVQSLDITENEILLTKEKSQDQ